jgi:hypothetical protein
VRFLYGCTRLNLVNEWAKSLLDQETNDPVRGIKGTRQLEFGPFAHSCKFVWLRRVPREFKVSAQQAFVDVAKLPNFQVSIVDRPPLELFLPCALAGPSGENEVPQDIGEGLVADAPSFQEGVNLAVEESAVIEGHAASCIRSGAVSINEMEEFAELVIKVGNLITLEFVGRL